MEVPQRTRVGPGCLSNTPYPFSMVQHRAQFTAHHSNRWHLSSTLILSGSWKEEFPISTVTTSDKGCILLPLLVYYSHQRVLEKQNTERFVSLCTICFHFTKKKNLTPKLNCGNEEKILDLSDEPHAQALRSALEHKV